MASPCRWPRCQLAAADPAPNFSGTYRLNAVESPPKVGGLHDTVWKIEQHGALVKYEATGIMGFSQPFKESAEFSTDGKKTQVVGTATLVGSLEDGAIVMRYLVQGKETARFTLKLSAGGKRLVRDGSFPDGRRTHEVYDRQ